MSRLDFATVAILAICLGAFALLIVRVVNITSGDEGEQPVPTEEVESYNEYFPDDASETVSDPIEEEVTTRDQSPGSEIDTQPDAFEEDTTTPAEVLEEEEDSDEPPIEENQATAVPESYDETATEGSYLVVAGAFTIRENAENLVKELRDLGFANARLGLSGKYATVIVDSHEKLGEARATTKQVIDQGFSQAYVHRKD